MKKSITLLALGAIALGAHAQYQVANSGFEEWEDVSYTYGAIRKTTVQGEEPLHWNSFLTGTGKLKSTAATKNQLTKSTESHSGNYSAKLVDRTVLGTIVAQGNMTTGCINMGSMTASDASGNYNYTDTSKDDFNQKFTGLPDSMHVWVKYVSTTESMRAKATTVLHTSGYYQDPYGNASTIGDTKLVATAANTSIVSSDNWQELSIPFEYSLTDGTRPAYALVSFATNSTPGSGTGSDYMLVDDLEYIYCHSLTALSYNDVSIYKDGTTSYDLSTETYEASKLSYTKKGQGATVETSYNDETAVLTITVKGDNYSADNTSVTTYTIQFKKEEKVSSSQLTSLSVNGTEVNGFAPATYSYTVSSNYDETTEVTYTTSDEAESLASYDEESGVYTILVATEEKMNTYTLQFNKPTSVVSYTNSLSVDVNGSTTSPQTTNFQVITRADGKTTVFVLKNFKLGEGDAAIAVGNIKLVGVTVNGNKYTTDQKVVIENGDDLEENWMGPQLGEVPVVLNGTLSGSQFNATIDIDMQETLKQTIKVVLAPEVQVNKKTDVELSDGLANVVFSRSFNKGWSTLVLPFDYTAKQLGASQIATLSAANSSDVYFTLSEDGKIEANTPYLVNFDEATDVEFTYGGEVEATDETNDASYKLSNDSTFMFAANYTANLSLANLGMTCYGLVNDGETSYIQKAGSSATLPSTCCYFALANVEPGAMEPLSFSVKFTDGTTDGINSDLVIENGEVKEKAHGIYNLQGVKVANDSTKGLPAGLYIANGKKVLVK